MPRFYSWASVIGDPPCVIRRKWLSESSHGVKINWSPEVSLMTRRDAIATAFAVSLPALGAETKPKASGRVRTERLPNGGIQPQVVIEGRGTVHLLYYSGDAKAGNVFYTRSSEGGARFAPALQVNSNPGSAIAAGTIRGAQLALGRAGRVHAAWNGSGEGGLRGPVNPDSGKPGSPMLYSRLNESKTAFEPKKNLMHGSFRLDGGGSLAADAMGNVYVLWHGISTEEKSGAGLEGEARRQVWLAKSSDDGRTFNDESRAWEKPTGACACCGIKAFSTREGTIHALYRSATEGVHRDIYLITSKDHGKSFDGGLLHKWEINACPMSSMDFAQNSKTVVGAWETGGQVYWARITGDKPEALKPVAAPGEMKGRKHPRVALNDSGELLFVWTEGMGWQRGGSLAWQLYDRSGEPTAEKGRIEGGVPTWSFAAPAANPDGSFLILH